MKQHTNVHVHIGNTAPCDTPDATPPRSSHSSITEGFAGHVAIFIVVAALMLVLGAVIAAATVVLAFVLAVVVFTLAITVPTKIAARHIADRTSTPPMLARPIPATCRELAAPTRALTAAPMTQHAPRSTPT